MSAEVVAFELAGLVIVEAMVRNGADPAEAERELDRVVAEFVQQGPTPAELDRAQSRILARELRAAERLGGQGGRSDILARSALYDGRSDGYLDRLQRLATTTPAGVREAAHRWLDAPHYTLTVVPVADLNPQRTAVDRTVLPPLGEPPDVAFPAVQRATLTNGLKVMLLERHSTPIVNVAMAVDAGYASDTADRAGLASLALQLLDDGTTSRDTFAISDALDSLGATLTTSSSLDLSLVRLQALSARLGPSLDLLADVVLSPSFPQDQVDLAKKQRVAQIAQELATPTAAVQRVVPALLFGLDHAYGKGHQVSGTTPVRQLRTADAHARGVPVARSRPTGQRGAVADGDHRPDGDAQRQRPGLRRHLRVRGSVPRRSHRGHRLPRVDRLRTCVDRLVGRSRRRPCGGRPGGSVADAVPEQSAGDPGVQLDADVPPVAASGSAHQHTTSRI